MVKGTSRRVIVVDSPDPKLFEQAIFIVRNDAFTQEGVTSQQVLGEACRIARGYASCQTKRPSLWRRLPLWAWLTAAAGAAAALTAALLNTSVSPVSPSSSTSAQSGSLNAVPSSLPFLSVA